MNFQKFMHKSKMDKSDKKSDKRDNLETSLDWIPVDSDEECIPRCVFTSFLFEEKNVFKSEEIRKFSLPDNEKFLDKSLEKRPYFYFRHFILLTLDL